jgi:hypothetical protein
MKKCSRLHNIHVERINSQEFLNDLTLTVVHKDEFCTEAAEKASWALHAKERYVYKTEDKKF